MAWLGCIEGMIPAAWNRGMSATRERVAVQRLLTTWGPPGLSPDRWDTLLTAGLRLLRRVPGIR